MIASVACSSGGVVVKRWPFCTSIALAARPRAGRCRPAFAHSAVRREIGAMPSALRGRGAAHDGRGTAAGDGGCALSLRGGRPIALHVRATLLRVGSAATRKTDLAARPDQADSVARSGSEQPIRL